MIIQKIAYYPSLNPQSKISKKGQRYAAESDCPDSTNAKKGTTDTTNVDNERAAILNSIKQKIVGGFYNSEAVIDDVTNSLAKAFDKTL